MSLENLKFRAWDKEDNRMKEVFNLDFHRYTAIVGFRLSEPKSFLGDKPLIIMQSTGLKDKNGVEIYEGDIIDKGYHNFSIKNRVGYVEFNQGGDSDGWAHGDWLGWITNNYDSLLDVHEHCTVLGNKFENRELLDYDSE